MIDNNIIQSLGAGSGIDTSSLVDQLVEIEKAAPQERITVKKELYEAQISDYGSLKAAISTLQTSVEALVDEEGLYSKAASYTESNALVPTELDTDAPTGTYKFEVSALAQSQSLSSVEFTDPTDAVGEGTLAITFGTWNGGTTDFDANTEKDALSITIDSSNNSLEGLRDAINNEDAGIQASIVNTGTGYVLSITAESGDNNQLSIVATETTPDGDVNAGLSRFDYYYDEGGATAHQRLTQNQAGADATLKVNGLEVTRSTNTIDDVVDGLTFDLLSVEKDSDDNPIPVTVTVSDDKAFAEQTIRDFVSAYNTFLEEIEPFFGIDEETGERGSLYNDSLAKSVTSQFRTLIGSTIPGISGTNFTALTNVGIRTELDGTLEINEDDFSAALEDNFEDIQKIMAPNTDVDGSGVSINSYGTQTNAGNYSVSISTLPAKGYMTASAVTAGYLDTTAKDYTFTATINGVDSAAITLEQKVYASNDELASAIQSAINADDTLQDNNASVVVTFDTDHFVVTSNKYGSSSSVSFSSISEDMQNFMGMDPDLSQMTSTSGINVAGVVDGVVADGFGKVLRPKLGEDAEGLNLIVNENASTSYSYTASFSRGFSGELDDLMDQFLQTNGLFDTREANITSDLENLEDDQESLDRRMDSYHERLIQQFIAMENILNGLSQSGGFLDNLVNTLPFTASKD